MRCGIKDRIILLKTDVAESFRRERSKLLGGFICLILGIALGVYIGIKVGEKPSPFGIFAKLFHLYFAPFSYIGSDFLRFLLFSVIASLSFFLPYPRVYPVLALFFFGKYFGQLSCVVFLSDSLISALLSILLVYLPLSIVGGYLLFRISLAAQDFRLSNCADFCRKSVVSELLFLLKILLSYFLILFLLYVILCGVIYLVTIAL